MLKVVGVNKEGNRIKSYIISDGYNPRNVDKRMLADLISKGHVSNATVQVWNGNVIIRIKDDVKTSKISGICGEALVNALMNTSNGTTLRISTDNGKRYKRYVYNGRIKWQGVGAFDLTDVVESKPFILTVDSIVNKGSMISALR